MAKNEVEWGAAKEKFKEISSENLRGMFISTLPYKAGILAVTTAALATFPMCFDLGTATWFNELHVTTELAAEKDLETWLEVGAWTWNWMEPPLGQVHALCHKYPWRSL